MTSDTAVREEIGWVREDHVKPAIGVSADEHVHEFNTVCLIEPHTELVIAKHALVRREFGALHHYQREVVFLPDPTVSFQSELPILFLPFAPDAKFVAHAPCKEGKVAFTKREATTETLGTGC